jgi:hypothetical protein
MARLKNGILGAFEGIVGPIEGYIRKGQFVIRSRRRKTNKVSELQKACRQRMTVVNHFTRSMTDFVRIGFGLEAAPTTKTANNLAKSYQLRYALKNEYPNLEMDYTKVRLTSGFLPLAKHPKASMEGTHMQFSWDFDSDTESENKRDQVMILVYYPKENSSFYSFSGARRADKMESMQVPSPKDGETAEVYISFISDDRKSISNSTYIGSFNNNGQIKQVFQAQEKIISQEETSLQQKTQSQKEIQLKDKIRLQDEVRIQQDMLFQEEVKAPGAIEMELRSEDALPADKLYIPEILKYISKSPAKLKVKRSGNARSWGKFHK